MGMVELPSGTVTFLFTDLEVSTRLWDREPDAMRAALARHDVILREVVSAQGGHVVKGTGDGVHVVFATADTAVRAAIGAQLALGVEQWTVSEPLRVRMGIHTGPAEQRDGDYYGTAVNRAARLMSVAHGGQIVVSHATEQLARDALDDGVDLVDLGEHRLRDLARAERVFQVTHANLRADFPALVSLDAFSTNLPLQLTTFVGRDDDVADVSAALTQSRVVTLIGVGGVGKTRLAVQTAADILDRYRDGVWLCELGPLSYPGQVPDVVATALGVQQRPEQSIAESLVSWLRSKELLVVLDNCEHLLDAAARLVAAIVGSCPGVTVLATGREGLGTRGERMMMVRSLPLPGEDATTDEILAADAVALFTERAQEAGGAVDLDAETAATVAQLCRRLDGIPLALELAAARTRMMSPQEIAARLDERFRLLTGGSRTGVERHQTLRQAVDWSYDLLAGRERLILDRLGVFSGGFTLEAAEAVVGGDDIGALAVLDGITQLVDKSLVVAEREHHDTRYRLLETIRQYALERLDERGATDSMRRRHATWCAEFVAQVGMQHSDEAAWLARLDREIDNVRAALTWATGADDAHLSLTLVGSIGFWTLWGRGLGYLLGPWAGAALATTGATDDPRFAQVLAVQALDHLNHQRINEAERDARQAIELMAEPGIPFDVGPWSVLCLLLLTSGRADEVEGADAFLDAARATGDDYTVAAALSIVAGWFYTLGDHERSLPLAEEAMLLAERIRNPTLRGLTGFYLGGALETTDPARARAIFQTAIDQLTAVGAGYMISATLVSLARLGTDAASPKWAREFRSGLVITYEAGDVSGVLMALGMYAHALANTDRVESATMLLASVGELSPHMSGPIAHAHSHRANERLLAQLDAERFAELSARGATLGYEAAVSLAFAELDRVISQDNGD
jgi:predicted ATPase/class 3 adenylate cyclase